MEDNKCINKLILYVGGKEWDSGKPLFLMNWCEKCLVIFILALHVEFAPDILSQDNCSECE